jgi:hypothetical protein
MILTPEEVDFYCAKMAELEVFGNAARVHMGFPEYTPEEIAKKVREMIEDQRRRKELMK